MNKQHKPVFELIKKFYEFKKYYLSKFSKKKKGIKCLICDNEGGNIFTENRNFLEVVCNAKIKCPFHIKIRLGKRRNFDRFKKEINKEIEHLKFKIMKLKLDLLFELENESVVLAEFSLIKEQLQEKQILLSQAQKEYNKNFIVEEEQEDLEDQEETTSKAKNAEKIILKDSREKIIKQLDMRIKNEVNYYNQILKKYETVKNTEPDHSTNENLLKEALNVYIDTIIPLMDKKHELSYQVYEININESGKGKNSVLQYEVYSKFINDENKEIKIGENDYKILINKGLEFTKKRTKKVKKVKVKK